MHKRAVARAGLTRTGLMATAFTMEETFYTDRLEDAGLLPLVPGPGDRALVHRVIYEELCRDVVRETSRDDYIAVAAHLAEAGADSLILGCTEVGMQLNAENSPLPVFDATLIHCQKALELALS